MYRNLLLSLSFLLLQILLMSYQDLSMFISPAVTNRYLLFITLMILLHLCKDPYIIYIDDIALYIYSALKTLTPEADFLTLKRQGNTTISDNKFISYIFHYLLSIYLDRAMSSILRMSFTVSAANSMALVLTRRG
jgi:hypothetical protein